MDDQKAENYTTMKSIWQSDQQGVAQEGEHRALANAMREHPEYANIWERLDQMEDGEWDREGVNPVLHIQLHAAVETQIAQHNPPEVEEFVKALQRKGISRHEAIHVIALELVMEMAEMVKEKRSYDGSRYLRRLRRAVRKAK